MSADLPEWVVERVARRLDPFAFEAADVLGPCKRAAGIKAEACERAAASLAEFLAILEERELRIVPAELPAMVEVDDYGHAVIATGGFWDAMLAAAQPLAELLEDHTPSEGIMSERDPIEAALSAFAREFWDEMPHAQERGECGMRLRCCFGGPHTETKWPDLAPSVRTAIAAYLRAEADQSQSIGREALLTRLAAEVERS